MKLPLSQSSWQRENANRRVRTLEMLYRVALLLVMLPLLAAPASAQVAATPAGAITGRLLSLGTPVGGIRIAAIAAAEPDGGRVAGPTILSLAETDGAGGYRLENVPPGRYYIQAGRPDAPSYYPGTPVLSDATVVTVAAGSTRSGLDFRFVRPSGIVRLERTPADVSGRFSGVVMDGAGAPLPNTTIVLSSPRTTGRFITCTDRAGAFEFLQLPAGEFLMEVLPAVMTGWQNAGYESMTDFVTIQSGESLYEEIRSRMIISLARSLQLRTDLYVRPAHERRGITVGGAGGVLRGIQEPTLPYPSNADAKAGDSVTLQAFIGTDGTLISLRVMSPDANAELARAALRELISWTFTPFMSGAFQPQPAQRIGTITVNFARP